MKSLFKTELGKEEILKLYDEKLNELNLNFEELEIVTKFGATRVLTVGDEKNQPLIIVHGSNGCAPISLETYPNLYKNFQVFAVDVIGQPNKSDTTQMNLKDNSYGEWLNELISKLNLDEVILVGFSLGGLIILKTLLEDEQKIKKVYLACPAFIANGNPIKALFKIFIPMKRFMKTKNQKYMESFLSALFTTRDSFALAYLTKVFSHFKMDFSPVPVISKQEAETIKTPIAIFGGAKDIIFPGKKVLKRANKIFSKVENSILLETSKHVQNKADNERIENLIINENVLK